MAFSKQLPQGVPFVDKRNMVDYRWVAVLNTLTNNLPPGGVGYVIDGSESTYGQMTLYQGLDANKGGSPSSGSIYFALDTGTIYFASGGNWYPLSEELTGDVTKPANSTVTTLATVNAAVGTWGDASNYPVVTVDAKGRVTNVTLEPSGASPVTPGGPATAVQYNSSGTFGGSSTFTYDPTLNTLTIPIGFVTGQLQFSNPVPTMNNLSPLTTKGDLMTKNGLLPNDNIRVPVGTDGQVLSADSTATGGLKWVNTGRAEYPFNYGDATPKNLLLIAANKIIEEVSIIIMTALDDPAATLSVGDAGDVNRLLATTDNIPSQAGTYTVAPAYKYGVNTQTTLSITPGTSTQGSGLVVITYQN